ncbi:ferrochelatase [Tessaracoccus sp. OS52]|uniref:ferrochelatase n=1 Tax=Tessaracoccus sp. OS52 TaxID=2886691 RepID=UPI001D113F57|nr:ferrochelatase [Tessaracoccus sp. OS52]MCC2592634.1 ferrochelatase [Tessaracoccus sp. OS52]
MNHSLHPYTAVLVASYGGPDKPDDVLPFMRNATAGRGIPDERLLEVSEHYMLFGGKSPINERNAELLEALRAELAFRNIDVPVVIGNRNWHPFHSETVPALVAEGHTRVLGLATSAYSSYSSCRQYAEDLQRATEGVDGAIRIDKIAPFAESEGFVTANADAVVAALTKLREQPIDGAVRVLFVTHSIPTAMNAASGDGSPACTTYDQQHLRVAERVAARVEQLTGEQIAWELTFCSRSGSPHTPWLEPDVNDRLAQLQAEGVGGVVASPIGFITDHMEVVYDLDTEAVATATELELPFVRAATVGTHPAFVRMLVDKLEARAELARSGAAELTLADYLARPCCLLRPAEVKEHA